MTNINEATAADPRLERWLARRPDASRAAEVCLIGFPSDEGVRRNGGRVGASQGPSAIRRAFYRMTPDARAPEAFIALLERTFDLGDVAISGDLERDQAAFGEAIAPHLKRGAIVIALGGGHEIAFGHFLGYVNAGLDVSIHNWDAHPDVRPLAEGRGHSGSPFRQALEHPSGRCKAYTVAGLLPHAVASAHIEYMRERGARAIWRDEIDATKVRDIAGGIDSPTMATFDLDAVDQSEAPGVSAPGVGGMSAELWLMAAEAAGRNPNVKSMDVVELNPSFDIDGRTARLAALTVWRFMKGLASRRVGA